MARLLLPLHDRGNTTGWSNCDKIQYSEDQTPLGEILMQMQDSYNTNKYTFQKIFFILNLQWHLECFQPKKDKLWTISFIWFSGIWNVHRLNGFLTVKGLKKMQGILKLKIGSYVSIKLNNSFLCKNTLYVAERRINLKRQTCTLIYWPERKAEKKNRLLP